MSALARIDSSRLKAALGPIEARKLRAAITTGIAMMDEVSLKGGSSCAPPTSPNDIELLQLDRLVIVRRLHSSQESK
jgi:hypothetical protein